MSFAKRLIILTSLWLALILASVLMFSYRRGQTIFAQQDAQIQGQALAYFRNRLQAHQDNLALYAQSMARNTVVQEALSRGDRDTLKFFIEDSLDTSQYTYRFYLPPGLYFVGNAPENGFDKTSILEQVFESGRTETGWAIEDGQGLSVFALTPVYNQEHLIGALEISTPITGQMLQKMTSYIAAHWQIDIRSDLAAAYHVRGVETDTNPSNDLITIQASSQYIPVLSSQDAYTKALNDAIAINTVQQGKQTYQIISAPITSPDGQIIGVADIILNNTGLARQKLLIILGNLTMLLGIIALSGFGLALTLNRSLAPLQNITHAMKLVAAGHYDHTIEVTRDDEIGLLIKTFNNMVAQVRGLVNQLDQRVKERTQTLQRHASLLQAAADIGQLLVSYQNIDEVLYQMVRRISERYGFYHVGIFMIDEGKQYAVLKAANSTGGQRMLSRGHRLRVGQVGIVGFVAASGQPRIALDVGQDAVYFDNPDLPETHSEMALPIIIQQEVIGVLDIQSRQTNAFSENDIIALQSLANQLAIAIENSRLYQQTQEAINRANAVSEAQTRKTWQILAADNTTLGFISSRTGIDTLIPEQKLSDLQKRALELGKTIISDDGTTIAAPIRVRNVIIGVMQLKKHPFDPAWQPEDVNTLTLLVEQFSAAIENARLYTEAQRRAAVESAIDSVAGKLSLASDIESVLRETAQALTQYLSDAEVTVRMTPQSGETPDA